MEEVQKKYSIKPFKPKSGKQSQLRNEEIDTSIYRPTARCGAFITTEEKILFWVKALQNRYFEPLDDNDTYHIKWIDHYDEDGTAFEHIELKISRLNGDHRTLLFTLSVYLTTGVIMCQGAAYELWCTKEFPQMKQCVNEIYSSAQGASDGSEHLGMNADGKLITNLEEAFELVQSMKKKRTPVVTKLSERYF